MTKQSRLRLYGCLPEWLAASWLGCSVPEIAQPTHLLPQAPSRQAGMRVGRGVGYLAG